MGAEVLPSDVSVSNFEEVEAGAPHWVYVGWLTVSGVEVEVPFF